MISIVRYILPLAKFYGIIKYRSYMQLCYRNHIIIIEEEFI